MNAWPAPSAVVYVPATFLYGASIVGKLSTSPSSREATASSISWIEDSSSADALSYLADRARFLSSLALPCERFFSRRFISWANDRFLPPRLTLGSSKSALILSSFSSALRSIFSAASSFFWADLTDSAG